MPRRSRQARRLLVGDATYLWTVGHDHQHVEDPATGHHRFVDCREILTLRRLGSAGRLSVVFRQAPGRLVPDGFLHSGTVGTTAGRWLNLHEPGAARALLDEASARGWAPGSTAVVDGWRLFDVVVAQRRAGRV
ncbi:hypothetical protein [Streptacidiphilus anmyonensis]|uniref:hypothetical protein n=1 Tax=Streptacidiphilus anmyonensis TaxID=405782 RepID=UPI0005A7A93B|nr:hypothetical protein [Streptacidiphilus anmyonensis]